MEWRALRPRVPPVSDLFIALLDRASATRAGPGGWFSYELAVVSGEKNFVLCTYWGDEQGRRQFDIQVDGTLAHEFTDPDLTPDLLPTGGKIGFRAIGSQVIAEIANFRVTALR